MKNAVQLITYADRLSGGDLKTLYSLLTNQFKGLFGGVHILPFYHPYDGVDAGFDPIDHTMVDPRLGNWDDIKQISGQVAVMADLIVNHISRDSDQFKDFLLHGNDSVYNGLFLTYHHVFPHGATEEELLTIYRPRPGMPFTSLPLADGSKRLFWTTFTDKQMDIDVHHPLGQQYLYDILRTFNQNGIGMIRLDAAGYAIKKAGSSCFMIDETFDFIGSLTKFAHTLNIEVLVEIHSYYLTQIEIAKRVDWVYDFALPPLILHAIFDQTSKNLKTWLQISPRNAITVLDTHDGIGIVDVGPQGKDHPGLLTPEEIDLLVEQIHIRSDGKSRRATGEAASNLDLYQVNCTYYDALGQDDQAYLMARIIQFFAPGIPQVYYAGLLAGENDMELLAQTKVGRDINRHYYTLNEVDQALARPVVLGLCRLIEFRNMHLSFRGDFSITPSDDNQLTMRWENQEHWSEAAINFKDKSFEIVYSEAEKTTKVVNALDF